MDSIVDPSAEFLFDSVAMVADEHGISEKAPRTDEEWTGSAAAGDPTDRSAQSPGDEGAQGRAAEDTSKNPDIELHPAQIQALIDADPATFLDRARTLQDAAMMALKASDARNKDALFSALERIDKACENCHLHYWYPNDKRAQEAARQQ